MNNCLIASGNVNKDGYVRAPGRTYRFGKRITFAHQVALIDHLGRLPREGYQANHGCDTPTCISTAPGHIYEGTQRENIADRHRRGRDARISRPGEESFAAKLTWDIVTEIRARYRPRVVTQDQLAREYGITQSNVHFIVTGATWKVPK